MIGLFSKIFLFYYNWFRNLGSTWKKLWALIIFKAILILSMLFFFFPDKLSQYETESEKSDAVANSLLK